MWNLRGFPTPYLIDGETEANKGSDLSKVPETRFSGWFQRGYFRVVLRPGTLSAGGRGSLGLGVPWLPLSFVRISAFLSGIIFRSAAHTLITSPSISSELPERSLEHLEHLTPLRQRELGSLPFPGSESQPGFSNLFEKL